MKDSKMQKMLDRALAEYDAGNHREAFLQLIEALKLLSKGMQQVMSKVDDVGSRNPFIGGQP